jgi:hypothetical protein
MKNTAIFIVFVLAVLGLLYAISGTRAPRIPENEAHSVFDNNKVCMECHADGGRVPRKPGHPPKDQCIECHKVKRGRKA